MDNIQSSNLSNSSARRRFSAKERAEHLEGWRSSGLSAAAYSCLHDVTESNLYAWSRKERLGESEQKEHSLLPVMIAPKVGADTASRVALRCDGLEIELSGFAGNEALVSLIKALRKEVLDV